jgi:hypothetical protein
MLALSMALLAAAADSVPLPPGSIAGTFLERSRAPLAAVEVVARRASDSTVVAHTSTRPDGRFRLAGLPLGRYLVRGTMLGYLPYRADVALTSDAPARDLGELVLAISPIPVPGVVTTTERATTILAPDRNLYLTKDMPAAQAGNATDVLRAVPELEVDMDGRVSLRGSSSVTIQLNGRDAPMKGDALTAFLKQFPASRIERVEVIANPSARYDPEGTAGIVNIVLKEHADLGLSGSVALTAGDRSNGVSPRVAYQRGPLTFFGGVNVSRNRNRNSFDDFRENLLTSPLSFYRLNSSNTFSGSFGLCDCSVDWAFSKRSTLYASYNGYLNDNDTDGATRNELLDDALVATSSYARANQGTFRSHAGPLTLGYRRVVTPDRDEWTLELRDNRNTYEADNHGLRHDLVPGQSPDETSISTSTNGNRERSIQFDGARPIGARGKLEAGVRGSERRATNSSGLAFLHGDTLVVTPQSMVTDYVHHEVFESGYLTLGSTFGKVSVQAGVRAEAARTDFDVLSSRSHYDNDYRSLFPSANVGLDLGKGRVVRVTYSKRIERPNPNLLNPDVPAIDSLNRIEGNPYLQPKYTHSVTLDGSWTGSRGSLRLSPYVRETVRNWDQIKLVDSSGAAITTWRNAASVRAYGASVTGSLRQTGKLGGSASVSVYRERHDASNVAAGDRHEATLWSANTNVTFKLTKLLDLQGSVRYNPAQTLAQGRISALTYSNVGARLKLLGEKAWANLYVNDPFNLWRYTFTTSDATHTQTSTNHYTVRSVSLSLTWTYGKPPEQKNRRAPTDQPSQDPTIQIH